MKMKKILLTGGAGFIGSAVVRQAILNQYSIINLDALTYSANLENLSLVSGNDQYYFEKINVLDQTSLDCAFMTHRPDAVMHLAAETHVDRSIDDPSTFIETNILGTFNLLEAARKYWNSIDCCPNFRFHHISTDEVFGSLNTGSDEKFTEQTAYDPRSPYSASKASADHLVRAWHHTYGLPVLLSNCSNNYGPFQFPEKLIPVVIINALLGRKIPIYGDGENVRDWLFVEDHANALILTLEEGSPGETYIIGGDNEMTNLQLIQMILAELELLKPRKQGSYTELIEFISDRPGHDRRYAVDTSKISNDLGWHPSMSLKQGLNVTVAWYLQNESWWRPLLKHKGVGVRLGTGKK